jgi:hypothetical protein
VKISFDGGTVLGGKVVGFESGQESQRMARYGAVSTPWQERRVRLVEEVRRVVPAEERARRIAVAQAGLPVEVTAPKNEGVEGRAFLHQVETVDVALPGEEGPAVEGPRKGEPTGVEGRSFATQAAATTDPTKDEGVTAAGPPCDLVIDGTKNENHSLEEATEKAVRHGVPRLGSAGR